MIDANEVLYIKLGKQGVWEEECLRDGTIRFGYGETPHELCVSRDWDAVRDVWLNVRGDAGTATRDMQQIRAFYETGPKDIFIAFHGGLMYWCHPTGDVVVNNDGTRTRGTVSGWSPESVNGTLLSVDRLSGSLLRVEGYRGTICRVKPREYLLRKLSDRPLDEVEEATTAEKLLLAATKKLMRLLTWKDFELLVDLVFSSSGWRRVSAVGKQAKTIDIELVQTTTNERAFVQVKSQTKTKGLLDYIGLFQAGEYDRMFFVYHSGRPELPEAVEGVHLLGPDELAQLVYDSGLIGWVKDKVG